VPAILIIDFASRLIVRNAALAPPEHQLFSRALILSHGSRARPSGLNRTPFFNTVLWIVDKEGDLPHWFLIGNPRIRHVPVAKPDHLAPATCPAAGISGQPAAASVEAKCSQALHLLRIFQSQLHGRHHHGNFGRRSPDRRHQLSGTGFDAEESATCTASRAWCGDCP
jgi:hypothetical protein